MKVARTYTIDHDLVVRLARKHNQSKEVCKAIRKHLDGECAFDIQSFSTRDLILELMLRDDVDPMIQAVVRQHIRG